MGGGVSKRVVPTFWVSVILNDNPVTQIEVAETATLSDARKEVELEAQEFPEIPQEGAFYFICKGCKCSKRKESARTVREAAGPDSLLTIVMAEATTAEEVAHGRHAATYMLQ